MSDFYAIGKIVRSTGLRGAVIVEPLTEDPNRFRELQIVWIETRKAEYRAFQVEELGVKSRSVRVELEGIGNRDAANALVGKPLYVTEEDLIEKKKGTYFIHEIIGLNVIDVQGEKIGKVTEVWKLPANDVYVVQNGNREYLIPAIQSIIRKIDIGQRKIEIQTIKGLLD